MEITARDAAIYPHPGTSVPNQWRFSPDGAWLTYLDSPQLTLEQRLHAYHLSTGERRCLFDPSRGDEDEATLSLEERLRRERTRTRAVGVTHYTWAQHAPKLLIPFAGEIFVLDGDLSTPRKVATNGHGPVLDPQFAPDGSSIAYVQGSEIWVVATDGGAPRQVTHGARESGNTHGLAEYIAQEEMGRTQGFGWSPDGAWLAFTEGDETHIPIYRIVHQGKDSVGASAQEDHRYPFAGAQNARVRLGVVRSNGQECNWMDLGDDEDVYLARVAWWPDGRLVAQIENRAQTELRLVAFDPTTGAPTPLLTETNATWINLHDMLYPLADGGFIWASERTGYMHLYRYDAGGHLMKSITQGEWMVDEVHCVDQARGLVYFSSTMAHPLERQLYVVNIEGGEIARLSEGAGFHSAVFDGEGRYYVDIAEDLDLTPTVTLRSTQNHGVLRELPRTRDPRIEDFALTPPETRAFQSRDGVTLYAAVYRPATERFGIGPYPVVVSVYGGPHAQRVTRSWALTADMRAQYLRSLGFLVMKVDNRGSARRGLAFEGAIKGHLGALEVRDQVDGVQWLVDEGLADPERVGIVGWSYGGYMAAMCLAQAPETFKAAVAGAPVTHWDGYDTHYTERYMGMPEDNAEGYSASSVMAHASHIEGALLLVHGLIDENVHFRHTARLINALIRAGKPYDLLLFPDERHMPRGLEDRVYMESRIRDFFAAIL